MSMFLRLPEEKSIRAVFAASLENIDRLCDEVREIMKSEHLEKHLFDVELLVREALNNAVLHGSGGDAGMLVQCTIRISADSIVIDVADEGDGFDRNKGVERNREKQLSPSGRGLDIMNAYAAEVSFNEKGNRLVLTKRL